MTARQFDTSTTASPEELSVVRLTHGMDVDSHDRLAAGSLGTIVFVHDEGAAYEVEFTEPFAAVITLRRSDLEPAKQRARLRRRTRHGRPMI